MSLKDLARAIRNARARLRRASDRASIHVVQEQSRQLQGLLDKRAVIRGRKRGKRVAKWPDQKWM